MVLELGNSGRCLRLLVLLRAPEDARRRHHPVWAITPHLVGSVPYYHRPYTLASETVERSIPPSPFRGTRAAYAARAIAGAARPARRKGRTLETPVFLAFESVPCYGRCIPARPSANRPIRRSLSPPTSCTRDSNPRLPHYECGALPPELVQHDCRAGVATRIPEWRGPVACRARRIPSYAPNSPNALPSDVLSYRQSPILSPVRPATMPSRRSSWRGRAIPQLHPPRPRAG